MFCRSKISCHHFIVWTDVPLAVENLFHKQMVSTCCTFPFPLAMQHTSSFAQLADKFPCVVQQNQSFKIKQQSLKRGVSPCWGVYLHHNITGTISEEVVLNGRWSLVRGSRVYHLIYKQGHCLHVSPFYHRAVGIFKLNPSPSDKRQTSCFPPV